MDERNHPQHTGNKERQDGTNTGRSTDTTNRSASCSPLAPRAPGQHEAPSSLGYTISQL